MIDICRCAAKWREQLLHIVALNFLFGGLLFPSAVRLISHMSLYFLLDMRLVHALSLLILIVQA